MRCSRCGSQHCPSLTLLDVVPAAYSGNGMAVPLYGQCPAQVAAQAQQDRARRQEQQERQARDDARAAAIASYDDRHERLLRAVAAFIEVYTVTEESAANVWTVLRYRCHTPRDFVRSLRLVGPSDWHSVPALDAAGYADDELARWFAARARRDGVATQSIPWPEQVRSRWLNKAQWKSISYFSPNEQQVRRDGPARQGWRLPSNGDGHTVLLDADGELDLGPLHRSPDGMEWQPAALSYLTVAGMAALLGWREPLPRADK